MRKLWLALFALVLGFAPAQAQQTSWPPISGAVAFLGFYNSGTITMTTSGQPGFAQLDINGNLKVNVAAGAASGCAGTSGTPCIVDTNNSGNLYAAVTAPIPCTAQATWNTNTGQTGTKPATCDGSNALWVDIGALGGAAVAKGGVQVVNGGSTYQTVAASQTAQVLQTSTGAAGDYLSHCVIQPTTTAAGTVIVYDNATTIFTFTAGTLSNLAPIAVPFGAVSTSGAWKVTTGANETATCYGKFSALPFSLLRAFG